MNWITQSLNRKFILGTASGLLLSSLCFLLLFISMYRGMLTEERKAMANQVNQLLHTSLENAMLKRDLDGLRYIVSGLGRQSGIHSVMITNPAGEVRFANPEWQLGKKIGEAENVQAPNSHFLNTQSGEEVLRSINPVQNQEPCTSCHGPTQKHPINGVLIIDFDAEPIRRNALHTTLILMGSGALIVIINIAGGWWFIRRFILHPVSALSAASHALSEGHLETRVHLQGKDELSRLGETLNTMSARLQEKLQLLEENKTFMQALVDGIPDGIRVIATNHQVVLHNQAYLAQQGVSAEEAIRQPCYRTSHRRDEPCPPTLIRCPLLELAENDTPIKTLHHHSRKDGSTLDVEIYAAPITVLSHGQRHRFVVESIRDLTSRMKFSHEQSLSELGILAAGVAHEIHNPLASVRMALHVIEQNKGKPEELPHYLGIVDKEIDNCIAITERLLKLSQAPSAYTELVSIDDVIPETLSLLHWELEVNKIPLHIELKGASPFRVLATDSEMRMLVLNLSQNAIHAMPNGGTLNVVISRQDDMITLAFIDTGVGISQEDMPRIFHPFFSRRADRQHGTGLGLSIVKSIVESYRGHIQVESIPGQGSRFTVILPDADATTTNGPAQ